MARSQIDEKSLIREVLHDYLQDNAPAELAHLDLAYDGMYEVMQPDAHATSQEAEGSGLSGAQFVDTTIICASLWVAKSIFWSVVDPLLEDKVLPELDQIGASLVQRLGRPEMVRSIRTLLERAIRKHLGMPSE